MKQKNWLLAFIFLLIFLVFFSCNRKNENISINIINQEVENDIAENADQNIQSRPINKILYVAPSAGLNLRSVPNLQGERLRTLSQYTQINAFAMTIEKEIINGLRAPWYKVDTGSETGWLFGGYLIPFLSLDNDNRFAESGFIHFRWEIDRGSFYFPSRESLFSLAGMWFDLFQCDKNELHIIKNSIYAKHGYIFDSPDLQEFFNPLPWYKGEKTNIESDLTDDEIFFISIIDKIIDNYPQVENNHITGLWVLENVHLSATDEEANIIWAYHFFTAPAIRIYRNGIIYISGYLGLWSLKDNKFIVSQLNEEFNSMFKDINQIIDNINSDLIIDITIDEYTKDRIFITSNFTNDSNIWYKLENDPRIHVK